MRLTIKMRTRKKRRTGTCRKLSDLSMIHMNEYYGGDQGGDGFDLGLNLNDKWAVYEVSDNKHFAASAPREAPNPPTLVERLAGRDARDPLPPDHPYKSEL